MNIYRKKLINNSLGLNSIANYFIELNDKNDFIELHKFLKNKNLPVLVIGEGTNVVLPDIFEGIVVKPNFNEINFNELNNTISAGSSVNWHEFVIHTIHNNIVGFENLSSIPGSVGASPIQNIGAYGQEVSNLIESVDCYDYINNEFISLKNEDCNFSYRDSIFKKNNLLIYKLNFYTDSHKEHSLEYDSIKKYMTRNCIDPKKISTHDVSRMISDIRSITLPDPIEVPNAGSFFKNNVIKKSDIKLDKFSIDELVLWEIDSEKVKVGSARLIELIKNDLTKYENVDIYENHSLVLITNKNANQKNVIDFAEHIKERIYDTFHITLEIEPTVISN
jgi:UDP-N-acetylmuramate dehydrogenase